VGAAATFRGEAWARLGRSRTCCDLVSVVVRAGVGGAGVGVEPGPTRAGKFGIDFKFARPRATVGAMARAATRAIARRGDARVKRFEDDRQVMRLTTEILRLQRRLAKKVVGDAIGHRMLRVKANLVHGEWLRWLAEQMPFTHKTVSNYMMLARWSDERPQDIERLAHLGPTKMYLLAPLTPGVRRSLTSRTPIPIPGGGKKTIDVMTVVELRKVIDGGLATPPVRRLPIGEVIQGVTHDMAGLGARLDTLFARKREVDEPTARNVHDGLLALAAEVRAQFDL
jgi:hypothetical protein